MTPVDDQPELALARDPQQALVAIEIVRAQKTAGQAFTLACAASGLDDKEIYLSLKKPDGKHVDAGYFSNMKKGDATLHCDMVSQFCRVVGNTIYPEWIAYQVGCGLVMLKSEAERRADLAEERARAAETENKLLRELVGRPKS